MRGLLVGLVGRGAVAGHAVNSMRVFVEGTIGGPTSGVVKRRSNVDLGWVGIAERLKIAEIPKEKRAMTRRVCGDMRMTLDAAW